MNYTFQGYEEALLAKLASLKAPDGYLKELKGFAGEIVLTDTGLLAVLLNRFPAVLVEITEAAYTPGPPPMSTTVAGGAGRRRVSSSCVRHSSSRFAPVSRSCSPASS